jgi:hypothetical protein
VAGSQHQGTELQRTGPAGAESRTAARCDVAQGVKHVGEVVRVLGDQPAAGFAVGRGERAVLGEPPGQRAQRDHGGAEFVQQDSQATRMLVSERTAKRMVASLLNRIGAANRVEAAGLAGAYGLLDHDGDRPQ